MSGFAALEIGKKALLAQRFGLDVTANNIANVNTDGYSRRVAVLNEDISVRRNGFFMGNSVIVQKIQTFRSEYYDREIRNNISKRSSHDVDYQFLKRIETVLGEPLNDSVDDMITDFFGAFDQVALNPDNVALRSYIVERGVAISQRFNNIASNFDEFRQQTLNFVGSLTGTVNTLLKDIAELNKFVTYNTNKDGATSQQFIDQRELKLQELAKFMDIKVTSNEDNTLNVFVNGINVVSSTYYSEIDYKVTDNAGEKTVSIIKKDIDTGNETPLAIQAGELYSNVKLYNEILDPNDTSGNLSIYKELNDFVNAFVTQINALMATGYGMDDLSGPPPGRLFFDPLGTNAGTITINTSLIINPKDLPLSELPGEPGNTAIARKVARLAESKTFLNNLTPVEYYSGLVTRVGSAARVANDGLAASKAVDEQLNTQRESLMGVNLDEEAVNLIKFQKGFEAASRIISITNEMLTTLINLGK